MTLADFKLIELQAMNDAVVKTMHQHIVSLEYDILYADLPNTCPLCVFEFAFPRPTLYYEYCRCKYCPWKSIDQQSCQAPESNYYDNFSSILRLNSWSNRILAEIASRSIEPSI